VVRLAHPDHEEVAVLEERRFEVLRAIVEDFVTSNEPVGSRALAERRSLGVSPATVRNDMAVLEDEGYITQPHTSAGRVPTDKGYRLFVDKLAQVKPLSAAERRAIGSFLDGACELDDVVHRSVRLLAALTRQVAVVQYPRMSRTSVRHVELVGLGPSRLLLVLITDAGRVEQRTLEMPQPLTDIEVADLRAMVNASAAGRRLADVTAAVVGLQETSPRGLRPALDTVLATLLEMLVERPEERIAVAGTANLTRHPGDFPASLHEVLEALEEQVVLLRLLSVSSGGELQVTIGAENDLERLRATSIITTSYGAGVPLASMAVVGPTRMDYPSSISLARAVARYVGGILSTGAQP